MNPYFLALLFVGLPLGVGGMLIQGTCSWQSQHFSFWRRCTYRLFGLGVLLYGAWSGLWGVLMTLNWLFSLYKEVMHNANLILFWPVDWLFVVIGISLLKRGCPVRPHKWTSRCMVWLAKAHLIALAVLAVLWASGFLLQDVLPTLAVSGILAILCYWTLLTSGVQKE